MKAKTEDLLEMLEKGNTMDEYFSNNIDEIYPDSIPDILAYFLKIKEMKKSDAIKNSGIEKSYGYQIFSGIKTPSRDKAIMLCFGLKLTIDEAQSFLKKCKYSELYARDRRDATVIFHISHNLSMIDLNEALYDYNLPLFE